MDGRIARQTDIDSMLITLTKNKVERMTKMVDDKTKTLTGEKKTRIYSDEI